MLRIHRLNIHQVRWSASECQLQWCPATDRLLCIPGLDTLSHQILNGHLRCPWIQLSLLGKQSEHPFEEPYGRFCSVWPRCSWSSWHHLDSMRSVEFDEGWSRERHVTDNGFGLDVHRRHVLSELASVNSADAFNCCFPQSKLVAPSSIRRTRTL